MGITFEWDATKASLNKKKHSVGFDEAKAVFFDENAIVIHDPGRSDDEDRFIILGLSSVARLLVVCHCFREKNIIRIISARKATKKESFQYQGGVYEKRI